MLIKMNRLMRVWQTGLGLGMGFVTTKCSGGASSDNSTNSSIPVRDNLSVFQSVQYPANNPIEDRVAYTRLKSINGLTASVFDGHGGDLTAHYAANQINQVLDSRLAVNCPSGVADRQAIEKSLLEAYDAIENGFMAIFKQNIRSAAYRRVGACALTVVVLQDGVYVANAGDCEGVLIDPKKTIKINKRLNAGEPSQMERLRKQFPNEPDIVSCIKGTSYCYVKGRLQPTRSLGDFYLKSKEYNFTQLSVFTGPYITHVPMLSYHPLTKDSSHLLLASDGLWDELTTEQVAGFAADKPNSLANYMLSQALTSILQEHKLTREQLLKATDKRDLHDDISIVTVDIKKARQQMGWK